MYIGVDVGGTKLEAILTQPNKTGLKTISTLRTKTERDLGYEHIISKIAELINELLKKSKVRAIGLGLPGSIDPTTQLMTLGNTRVLENRPIIKDLKKLLIKKLPIYVENDANAFALAEVYAGAGLQFKKNSKKLPAEHTAIGVILGTGVGGGIIVNGKVLKGRRGSGGEIGHTTLYYDGVDCYCDRKGCVEQYLSGPALEQKYKMPSSEVFNHNNFITEYKKNLGRFLGNLTNVLDPDYFVLGGGISKQDSIYEELTTEVQKNLFVKHKPPAIFKHKISDSSGSLGAALVAWKEQQ